MTRSRCCELMSLSRASSHSWHDRRGYGDCKRVSCKAVTISDCERAGNNSAAGEACFGSAWTAANLPIFAPFLLFQRHFAHTSVRSSSRMAALDTDLDITLYRCAAAPDARPSLRTGVRSHAVRRGGTRHRDGGDTPRRRRFFLHFRALFEAIRRLPQ